MGVVGAGVCDPRRRKCIPESGRGKWKVHGASSALVVVGPTDREIPDRSHDPECRDVAKTVKRLRLPAIRSRKSFFFVGACARRLRAYTQPRLAEGHDLLAEQPKQTPFLTARHTGAERSS